MTATLDAATTTARLQQWLTANVEGWTDVAVAPIDVQHGSGWSAEIIFVDVSYKDANGPQNRTLVVRRQQRSEEHTSELQSLMRISYAVFCLKKKKNKQYTQKK